MIRPFLYAVLSTDAVSSHNELVLASQNCPQQNLYMPRRLEADWSTHSKFLVFRLQQCNIMGVDLEFLTQKPLLSTKLQIWDYLNESSTFFKD